MIYSDLYLKNKIKVPIIIGLISILISLFLAQKLLYSDSKPLKASQNAIKKLEISNLSPRQITIFWQTNNKEIGWIVFGKKENELKQIVLDERDSEKSKNLYINHYVNLKNLENNQKYFFAIISGNKIVRDIRDRPFSFKTISDIGNISNLKPAYGKVLKKNGEGLDNAVVLLMIEKAHLLSSLTKTTGEWLIPLNIVIDSNTGQSKTLSYQDKVKVEIISDDGVSVINAYLKNLTVAPETVIIGNNYDFLDKPQVLSETDYVMNKKTYPIDILYPKENAVISAGNPLILGSALPNSEVEVIVDLNTFFSANTKTDKTGRWRLILPNNLQPGEHAIILNAKNTEGKKITITRKFFISKQGEQVLAEATPSAYPTLFIPTITVTPVPPTQIYITATPPTTGIGMNFLFIPSASLIILGIGLLLAF